MMRLSELVRDGKIKNDKYVNKFMKLINCVIKDFTVYIEDGQVYVNCIVVQCGDTEYHICAEPREINTYPPAMYVHE